MMTLLICVPAACLVSWIAIPHYLRALDEMNRRYCKETLDRERQVVDWAEIVTPEKIDDPEIVTPTAAELEAMFNYTKGSQ
jgi:hypothetical protein